MLVIFVQVNFIIYLVLYCVVLYVVILLVKGTKVVKPQTKAFMINTFIDMVDAQILLKTAEF